MAAPAELEVWAELERVRAAIARPLDRTLIREHGLSLHGFEVLQAIASTAAQRLRMSELAERVPLTASGVTRLVGRLERDGLVGRVDCSDDARVTYTRLTDAGRAKLHAAAETHDAAVRELLHARFPDDAVRELRRCLDAGRRPSHR